MPRTIRALPVLIANSHIVPAWATQDNLGKWVREREGTLIILGQLTAAYTGC